MIEKIKKEHLYKKPKIEIFEFKNGELFFDPQIDPEYVIGLRGNEKEKLLKNDEGKYLDSENSCIQFGKMQPDGNTVYSPEIIKPFIKYILKHAKLNKGKGKVIIQLWPELAQSLSQRDGKEVLEFGQEKQKIEDIIRECIKECGEEGKNVEIEIQNVADNYPDVFDAIKNKGKDGIIPKEEPKLEDFELPLKSPLPIINYLAYHYSGNTDQNLKTLFYETKPAKYKEQDGEKHEPGTSDADYYSIVEVGIRLFEVLNGRFIQGGIDRQKVYDKIIYLILFGEDKISGEKLKLEDYPKLGELHNRLMKCENYKDSKMMQLYIDLGKVEKYIEAQKNKKMKIVENLKERQERINSEKRRQAELPNRNGSKQSGSLVRFWTTIALLLTLWGGAGLLSNNNKETEISKVLIETPVKPLQGKFSIKNIPQDIIENTIKSELNDFEYIDYDRALHMSGLLEMQRKGFEYEIDGERYYCIVAIYGDKTLLLAKTIGGSCVYSIGDGKKVAMHMIKNRRKTKFLGQKP